MINEGDRPVLISSVSLAGSDNGLSLSSTGCAEGMELIPTEACALTVNWLPRREGPVIDDIKIFSGILFSWWHKKFMFLNFLIFSMK